jgi:hypothetical protein
MTAGALAGASTWQAVITAADGRCECTGACGRNHAKDGGRCTRESLPGHPLRAVPRAPVPDVAAAYLAAAELTALCAPCADDIGRRGRTTAAAAAVQVMHEAMPALFGTGSREADHA